MHRFDGYANNRAAAWLRLARLQAFSEGKRRARRLHGMPSLHAFYMCKDW
jgi:hypothetical protein